MKPARLEIAGVLGIGLVKVDAVIVPAKKTGRPAPGSGGGGAIENKVA